MRTFKYRGQEIQVDYQELEVKGEIDYQTATLIKEPSFKVIINSVFYEGTDITMILSQDDEAEILETIYDKLYN
jgi:hypothetical protein